MMERKSEEGNGMAMGMSMLIGSIGMIAFCVACLVTLVRCAKPTEESMGQEQVRDTIIDYVVDTIPYYEVMPRDSVVIRYVTQRLPVVDDKEDNFPNKVNNDEQNIPQSGNNVAENIPDSADVVIPITQKHYEDSTFSAWVSGYKANLDSIKVFPRKEVQTITIHAKEQKKWSIGVSGGIGVVYDGSWHCGPGINVGVTYSF